MASINLEFITEDMVLLVKGHIIQKNKDGTIKYISESNIEIPLDKILKSIK